MSESKYNNDLRFDLLPDAIASTTEDLMRDSKAVADGIAAPREDYTWLNTLQPWVDEDRSTQALESSLTFIGYVSPDEKVRAASTTARATLSRFAVEQGMRMDCYQAVTRFSETEEAKGLTGERRRLLDRILRDFKRKGLHLDENTREEMTRIDMRLSELCVQYSNHLNEEDTELRYTAEQLDGVPQDLLESLDRKDEKYVLTLKYPHYIPVQDKCRVPATRQSMMDAYNRRCIDTNAAIMEELGALRHERANLLGFATHADYVLDIRMAKTTATVNDFLSDLNTKMTELAAQEKESILKLKAEECTELGLESDGQINLWDVRYYQEMITKQQYQVDTEQVKQYFPLDHVTEQMLQIYQGLLGLSFTQVQDPHVWHEDVTLWNVCNREDSAMVGQFYLDLHPRNGKYGHAACFGLIPRATVHDEEGQATGLQYPVAAMVANFPRGLLPHDDVNTFFHEFGHVMHQLCSEAELARFAGTAVERDFVEAPSQMLENWVWTPEVLSLLSCHVDTKAALDGELLDKLVASRNANNGLLFKRQLFFGLIDQTLHSQPHTDTAALCQEKHQEVLGFAFPGGGNCLASFGHLAGGYDASYYGYMWSLVYSDDMFASMFEQRGVLNPETGMAYRKCILAPGGSRDGMDSLIAFLGREPNNEAFLQRRF